MKQEYFFSESTPTMYYPNFINSNNSGKDIAPFIQLVLVRKIRFGI